MDRKLRGPSFLDPLAGLPLLDPLALDPLALAGGRAGFPIVETPGWREAGLDT